MRRRDGVPLLLVREDRAESVTQGAFAAARALRNVLAHLPTADADDALAEEFPWVELLPAAECRRFSTDFVRAVGASAELGVWSVLVEWKATAAIYADPGLVGQLRGPVEGDFGAVPAPEGG